MTKFNFFSFFTDTINDWSGSLSNFVYGFGHDSLGHGNIPRHYEIIEREPCYSIEDCFVLVSDGSGSGCGPGDGVGRMDDRNL